MDAAINYSEAVSKRCGFCVRLTDLVCTEGRIRVKIKAVYV